eukprot:TRINITY_DN8769_c0_g1_i2.p1 TRINITY_DN8769_c0_g1~~TRINITY_DN8769_c0_g1_i2.p1  ORF type:complete len:133 (-),score=11.01 TRINITY_DN8769_c0_g1_i2:174-572(-)
MKNRNYCLQYARQVPKNLNKASFHHVKRKTEHYELFDVANLPNLLETSEFSNISQTCNFPFEPPEASKNGLSAEKDNVKTAPTFRLLDAMHVGWLFVISHNFTILSVDPVASSCKNRIMHIRSVNDWKFTMI